MSKFMKTKCQLQCMSKKIFIIEIGFLKKAKVFTSMLEASGIGFSDLYDIDPDVIPLPNISEPCMNLLLQYLTHHREDEDPPEDNMESVFNEVSEFDQSFLDAMDVDLLFEMAMQAHYLDVPILRELITSHIAKLVVKQDEERAEEEKKKAEQGTTDGTSAPVPVEGVADTGANAKQDVDAEVKPAETAEAEKSPTNADAGLESASEPVNPSDVNVSV